MTNINMLIGINIISKPSIILCINFSLIHLQLLNSINNINVARSNNINIPVKRIDTNSKITILGNNISNNPIKIYNNARLASKVFVISTISSKLYLILHFLIVFR